MDQKKKELIWEAQRLCNPNVSFGFDSDGKVSGLRDYPFVVPYLSRNWEARRIFRKRFLKAFEGPDGKPVPRQLQVQISVDPEKAPVHRAIGYVYSYEAPELWFRGEFVEAFHRTYTPGPDKPLIVKVDGLDPESEQFIVNNILNGALYHIELKRWDDRDHFVLTASPAEKQERVPPIPQDVRNQLCDDVENYGDAFARYHQGEWMRICPLDIQRKADEDKTIG